MGPTAGIRLFDIRQHEGSQHRAWEELNYQLRETPPAVTETRKTRAPDGGVEWYDIYEDGHQEGFQAKFHQSLESALSDMRKSVQTVVVKRPLMTHLTFLVPYDFTDAADPTRKSDQDRWDEAVARWQKELAGAEQLGFSVVRAGDVLGKLTKAENAGRRAYWFGELAIDDEWLARRWSETREVVGQRYTPEANVQTRVDDALEAVCQTARFREALSQSAAKVKRACESARRAWGTSGADAQIQIERLEIWLAQSFAQAPDTSDFVDEPTDDPSCAEAHDIAEQLQELAAARLEHELQEFSSELDDVAAAAREFARFTGSAYGAVADQRALVITGRAGFGKTHSLMDAAKRFLAAGIPAIVVPGQRLSNDNWWPCLANVLGIQGGADQFLQALDAMAEARGKRAVIMIDALNDVESPRRWSSEIRALRGHLQRYAHLSVVVTYRDDYEVLIGLARELPRVRHPGLRGHELDALTRYCDLFGIAVPTNSLWDPAFASPLFLRLYCELVAAGRIDPADAPPRADLYRKYTALRAAKVAERLSLSPASPAPAQAVTALCDLLLDSGSGTVPRALAEPAIDELKPQLTTWPNTLFGALLSEGLLEVTPTYDGDERVGLAFQEYSEFLVADRLIERAITESAAPTTASNRDDDNKAIHERLARHAGPAQWLWKALAVLVPQRLAVELDEILPPSAGGPWLEVALRDSLVDRPASAFGPSAHAQVIALLDSDAAPAAVDLILAMSARPNHPCNADWLHKWLLNQAMADRDVKWSIPAFTAEEESESFQRLAVWSQVRDRNIAAEEVRLAATALMWLFTSPNRFLRDRASKLLTSLVSSRLSVAAAIVRSAQDIDDPYVQERVLTCVYGAVMVGGDDDLDAVAQIRNAVGVWAKKGLPVDALARDAARGIAAWAESRGIGNAEFTAHVTPPYGSAPPSEPPTADELERVYGPVWGPDHHIRDWRAGSILTSCLTWMGDFNKYVVKGDVGQYSRYPLSGPAPTGKKRKDPLGAFEADWAGRWIANRAIQLGWTAERFADFESNHSSRRGRDGHQSERFGKKYQWIAHHELMARLTDNYHRAHDPWGDPSVGYRGPWDWYGRDLDPSLPPSASRGGSMVCTITETRNSDWASVSAPDLLDPDGAEWVGRTDDLPSAESLFAPQDDQGTTWIALQRYSTWHRENPLRRGITKRERDVFFLQFSWLVAKGKGSVLMDHIEKRRLKGRWMPDQQRPYQHFLGELSWAPASRDIVEQEIPESVLNAGITDLRPAVELYLWEGNTHDCSIDESVDFYMPTLELLGDARWIAYEAAWTSDQRVVCRAMAVGEKEQPHEVLIADRAWIDQRLQALNADLVIGTLSEKHALAPEVEEDYRHMEFSDITYVALARAGEPLHMSGPLVAVRSDSNDDDD